MDDIKKIQNPYIDLSIQDGIVIGIYKKDLKIDLEIAKQIVSDRVLLCDGKKYPTLGKISGNTSMGREVREYFGTTESVQGMTKMALVIDSRLTKVLYNWYVNLSKPLVPTRAFTDEQEAIVWLKES